MAIYKTPYDTTAGLGYRYTNIAHELRVALAAGALPIHATYEDPHHILKGQMEEPHLIALVQGGNSFADSVHFFKHPVFVRFDDKEYVCVDVREFGKWDAAQQRFAVRNISEYVWALKRALLTAIWDEGHYESLRDLSNLPAKVYCALLSESIARRFALDPAEQAIISVLACYMYYSLFTSETEIDEDEKNNLAGKISRVTFVSPNTVFQIIDKIPNRMANMQDFCTEATKNVGNTALENLNVGTLFSVVGGTWFGSNSREVLCMGMEHMPTWIMIVEASITAQTFKRATLSKISQRFDKRGSGDMFAQALTRMLGGANGIKDLEIYSDFFGSA